MPADAVGILTAPATISSDTIRGPGGCRFDTANGADMTTYVGSDMAAQVVWNTLRANADRLKYTPMSGVGDAAFWNTTDPIAFFAKKGAVYCSVNLDIAQTGIAGHTTTRGVELAKRMALLCTKAFAAR